MESRRVFFRGSNDVPHHQNLQGSFNFPCIGGGIKQSESMVEYYNDAAETTIFLVRNGALRTC